MFYLFLLVITILFQSNSFAQVTKIDKGNFSKPQVVSVDDLKKQIENIDQNIAGFQREIDNYSVMRVQLINELKAASTAGVTDATAAVDAIEKP